MIGLFFTNEQVKDYESAKQSDLQFFANYYKEMAKMVYSCRLLNLKESFFQLNIVMKIFKRLYRLPKKRLKRLNDKVKNVR